MKKKRAAVLLMAILLLLGAMGGTAALAASEGMTETTYKVFYKTDSPSGLREPTQFTYTVTMGEAVAATEDTLSVHAGVPGGVYFAAGANVTDAWPEKDSKSDYDQITVSFDARKFPVAGIYRYVIHQMPLTEAQKKARIYVDSEDGVSDSRILDLYVSKGEGGKLLVTGAVFSKAPTAVNVNDGKVEYGTQKSEGFANGCKVAPPTVVETGDSSQLALWAAGTALLAACGVGILLFLGLDRKRKKGKTENER